MDIVKCSKVVMREGAAKARARLLNSVGFIATIRDEETWFRIRLIAL